MGDLTKAIKEHMQMAAVLRESEGIKSLLAHSQETLDKGLSKGNMTVFTIGVEDERLNNGKYTVIPSFWNGKEEDQETSTVNAVQSGRKWPSGFDKEEAQFVDAYAHTKIYKQVAGENNATR